MRANTPETLKPPPLVLGATLLFWGWHTRMLVAAAVLAVAIEGSRLVRFRWEISGKDFIRISDACAILFVGLVISLFLTRKATAAFLAIMQWLPLALAPLLVAQMYSTTGKVDIGAVFWSGRKRKKGAGARPRRDVSLAYPFFGLCILCAGISNARTPLFFLGTFGLCAWVLWPVRSRRYPALAWICLMLLAGALGLYGHKSLHFMQLYLEDMSSQWYANRLLASTDPYRSITAMGDVGRIKQSSRILFRVKPGPGRPGPLLLRDASYYAFNRSTWQAPLGEMAPVPGNPGAGSWEFGPHGPSAGFVTVAMELAQGRGLIKAPIGTFRLENLPARILKKNRFGAVKAEDGPGLVIYKALYGSGLGQDGPPGPKDLLIPHQEAKAIQEVAGRLDLEHKLPSQVPETICGFFAQNFTYSLILEPELGKDTPLADFLKRSRSGHCEYFATAAVFLLRSAGIPARYAVGFLAEEQAGAPGWLVVRGRHAHAWALAYIAGEWHDVDATPPGWVEMEEDQAPAWQGAYDLLSSLWFGFLKFRHDEKASRYLLWLFLPLVVILGRRLMGVRARRRNAEKAVQDAPVKSGPGLDSEWYLIERRLEEHGFERLPSETIASFVSRVEQSGPARLDATALYGLMALHYRFRFDPLGLSEQERKKLHSHALAWLEKTARPDGPPKGAAANQEEERS